MDLEKLSQRHGEVVAPPMHHEVKATKTVGLGLRYHRGLGSDVNWRPCVRPVEASSFHVVRVRRKPCGVHADVGKSVYSQSPCRQSSDRLQRAE